MATTSKDFSSEILDRRPDARVFKIESLLDEVKRGRVRIPSFQRGIKWQREDALRLLDSIYRGYPIGTLLLWQTKAEAAAVQFGSVTIDAPASADGLWVVDGQQRIVSLTRTLLAPTPDGDTFALYFDLDESRFVSVPAKHDVDPGRWLPLTEVLDSERLFQWVLSHPSPRESRRSNAFALGKRIREYDIPAYVVREGSESTLRDIFGRINSYGKKLEANEVFDALHGARSSGTPATIDQIAEELQPLRFGRIENKLLYRLLRVLQGLDIVERTSDGPIRLSDDEAAKAYKQTAEVARNVIHFLKLDAGIPSYELLPYKQPLVTLGKFFSHHPTPKPRSRELLARWLWRSALNGSHRGDTVSTRQVLELIDPLDEEKSVQQMINLLSQPIAKNPSVSEPFNFRHAASKLQALALLELEPLDLITGDPLEFTQFFVGEPPEQEPPFPKIVVNGPSEGLIQSVANRLAYPHRSGLKKALAAVVDEAVLVSHGITVEAASALRAGDTQRFLAMRSEYLDGYMRGFFDRHAKWGDTDRPTLESMLVVDEDV